MYLELEGPDISHVLAEINTYKNLYEAKRKMLSISKQGLTGKKDISKRKPPSGKQTGLSCCTPPGSASSIVL